VDDDHVELVEGEEPVTEPPGVERPDAALRAALQRTDVFKGRVRMTRVVVAEEKDGEAHVMNLLSGRAKLVRPWGRGAPQISCTLT